MLDPFQGYLVTKADHQDPSGELTAVTQEQLPPGDLLVQVEYSSLNYKDALAATGHVGVAPTLPHIPGIDAVGKVVSSESDRFQTGDSVIIQGHDFGSRQWGAWAEYCRVDSEWAVQLPSGLSGREAIVYGTAGFTAAQCVAALVDHDVHPKNGPVVVTGSTGGVGLISIAILAMLDFEVVAVTGKLDRTDWLKSLGAARVEPRSSMADNSGRPMLSGKWAGGIDTVGGIALTTLLRELRHGGCVAACGLAADHHLEMTVYPFILRGAQLIGIDSAHCSIESRESIWSQLAGCWRFSRLMEYVEDVSLEEISQRVDLMLAGQTAGRTIIRIGTPN